MKKFIQIRLNKYYNTSIRNEVENRVKKGWSGEIKDACQHFPVERQTYRGIPFVPGPENLSQKNLIVISPGNPSVTVRINDFGKYICFLHFSNCDPFFLGYGKLGRSLADYEICFASGKRVVRTIRQKFEINAFGRGWGYNPYMSMPAQEYKLFNENEIKVSQWGQRMQQCVTQFVPFSPFVYCMPNPNPGQRIKEIVLRSTAGEPVGVLGITLYNGAGHPLRPLRRRTFELSLPPGEKAKPGEIKLDMDMGQVTRTRSSVPEAVPGAKWLRSKKKGLGVQIGDEVPVNKLLVDLTGAAGSDLSVKVKNREHKIPYGEAFEKGAAKSSDKKAGLKLLYDESTWVHVVVRDENNKPVPARVHFSGPKGEYIPPYGHQEEVNSHWFQDFSADLQLGRINFAYVPGRFQAELPVGDVYVEVTRGFEYEPLRQKVNIKSGQHRLELKLKRFTDRRKAGWVTADTHVHFITPETAWLEGQAEGLNLINLLASQWGNLFTNVGDITGNASGCSRDETIVWVGTENRHHLLGHISLLGTKGDPLFPMCSGGVDEAFFGDPDMTCLTEWADTCKKREGVVIRPHFPVPTCEEPVYIALGKVDGLELRDFANPAAGNLDLFPFKEWYRYLNCGYRVAAVGGTDKMSAGMPVGGVRTYAKLDKNQGFSFKNWGEAVRKGRTYTSSGPIMDLAVDGHGIGDDIKFGAGGGTVEVLATADCAWPIHRLEVIVNGQVVAATASKEGSKSLKIRQKVKLTGSSWIAARCSSVLKVHHCWPIHLGGHTSPVYVTVGGRKQFNMNDAQYMLTLIDGGLTYLENLSIRYTDAKQAKLMAMFEQAKQNIAGHMHNHLPGTHHHH